MTIITNTLSTVWDSTLGRLAIVGLSVGWMPFVLLSMAHSALTK